MLRAVHFFCAFLIILNFSCQYANPVEKENKITIDVQPFSGIEDEEVNYVFNELRKVYPNVVLNRPIPLPVSAFYTARNRYRADSLIQFLDRKTARGHVTIGLTNKDISTTKDAIADWGVMGLGFCPGKACIASSFRLSNPVKLMQLFKVAIHELGHTQGLPHCSIKSCFMRDAEGRNPTGEEKDFCNGCKKYLVNKGWNFKICRQ